MTVKVVTRVMALFVGFASVSLPAVPAMAQPPVQSPRLYVLDCGTIPNGVPERHSLTKSEVQSLIMAVPCFLVVHARGTLLYDAGIVDGENNPNRGAIFVPARRSVKGQLAELGYTPDKITYLMLSHDHEEHVGNANDYRSSTWLVQRAEYQAMFPENMENAPPHVILYKALKDSKTILLDGDRDVFGDGTVVIKSLPGHTPGHQGLFVKLAVTGPVVLGGDLYHWSEERTLNRLPTGAFDMQQLIASRAALEEFLKKTGAQLWVPHDFAAYTKLKKSPNYYE